MRRSAVAAIALTATFLFGAMPASQAAVTKVAVPKKVSFSVTATSARISWGLTKGTAPSRILVKCSVNNTSVISTSTKRTHISLTDLASSTQYDCKLVSVSGKTRGTAKALSFTTASSATVAGRPYNIVAQEHNQSATITWHAPASDGGSIITSYVVSSTPTSSGCTSATNSCTVTGLTNGVSYTFRVIARNAIGDSLLSISSNAVTPLDTAAAIDNIQTVPGDGFIDISWHLIHTVDNVLISWGNDSALIAGDSTTYRISSLPNCTSQTITFQTITSSMTSDSISALATAGGTSGIAGSVRDLAATTSSRAVHVSFTAPAYTGFVDTPISGYVITATAGANSTNVTVAGDATTADITNLDNNVQYTISVAAVNQCGTHLITNADQIVATPSWANRPATVIDLSDVNAVTKQVLAVNGSVGYQFTALDTFAVAGTYFALQPQCSTNGVLWSDCAVTVSVSLYDINGNQLNTIQYAYSDWYGTGLIPIRPEQPLVADDQYILVVTLLASSAAQTSIDVFSPALVW